MAVYLLGDDAKDTLPGAGLLPTDVLSPVFELLYGTLPATLCSESDNFYCQRNMMRAASKLMGGAQAAPFACAIVAFQIQAEGCSLQRGGTHRQNSPAQAPAVPLGAKSCIGEEECGRGEARGGGAAGFGQPLPAGRRTHGRRSNKFLQVQ